MSPLAIRAITHGPRHHFFGYFGLQPWDATGRFLLCLEVPFSNRPPTSRDKAIVGMVDLENSEFIRLGTTSAWNFQQGAMMQWMPNHPDSEIIFNDCKDGRVASVILNVHTLASREIGHPVSALSRDGRTALSINFGRLQHVRPGYGYAVTDPFARMRHPSRDCINLVDLETCEASPVVTLGDALRLYDRPDEIRNQTVCFNHTSYNTGNTRLAFMLQWRGYFLPRWARVWRFEKPRKVGSVMYTASLDGSDLAFLSGFERVSHYDWFNQNEILMWTKPSAGEPGFYLVNHRKGTCRAVGEGLLSEDGHCSFSPNRNWILVDTYPHNNYRELKIFGFRERKEIRLGRFYSYPLRAEMRCDLHPRWNRTGTEVCFDSVHEGTRQLYVMNVSEILEHS